jgi:hypothetical protein
MYFPISAIENLEQFLKQISEYLYYIIVYLLTL